MKTKLTNVLMFVLCFASLSIFAQDVNKTTTIKKKSMLVAKATSKKVSTKSTSESKVVKLDRSELDKTKSYKGYVKKTINPQTGVVTKEEYYIETPR